MHQPFSWTPESMHQKMSHKPWNHCELTQWFPYQVHPHSVYAFPESPYCRSPRPRTDRPTHLGFALNRPILWPRIPSALKKTDMHLANYDTIIHGRRKPSNGLYYIEINPQFSYPSSGPGPVTHAADVTVSNTCTVQRLELLSAHGQKRSTQVYFATWPGLKSELVPKHLTFSLSTTKGHLWKDRQNIHSTKYLPPTLIPETSALSENDPTIEHQVRSNRVLIKSITVIGKISTDQTGRFPVVSSRGSKYLMVLHDHDRNTILCEPLKYRSEHTLLRAYTALHSHLTDCGLRLIFNMLDNEFPASLKTFMHSKGFNLQLVPPHLHCTNSAKCAIQAYKDHLVAGLSSCDPACLLHLWDRLLSQETLTLNLLQPSRINQSPTHHSFSCNSLLGFLSFSQ